MAYGSLGRSVSIIGVGLSPLGLVLEHEEVLDCTQGELLGAACTEAFADAGIGPKDIDAFYLGQLGPGINDMMAGGAGHLAHWMGMKGKPGLSHDECCATSSFGIHEAATAVASGRYDFVLTATVNTPSVQIPHDRPAVFRTPKDAQRGLDETQYSVIDLNYSYPARGQLNPLDDWAVLYARKYGLSRAQMNEVMNRVCIIARENAVRNPKSLLATQTYAEEAADFGYDTAEEYLSDDIFNPYLDTMVRIKHNGPSVDGAAAQIVCPTEIARKICDHPIEIAGFGSTSGWDTDCAQMPIGLDVQAYRMAYEMAGITDPYTQVDHLALHDCSAQNWMYFSEDGGYLKPGEAWQAILDGRCDADGDKPINTSGGRMGVGHPMAPANGVEIYEAVKQMRGLCGERQLKKKLDTCVIQSVGGSWHFAATVLRNL